DVFKTDIWEREVKIQPWPTTAATATASRANPQAANSTNRARRRCASAMHARRVVPATISGPIRRSNRYRRIEDKDSRQGRRFYHRQLDARAKRDAHEYE